MLYHIAHLTRCICGKANESLLNWCRVKVREDILRRAVAVIVACHEQQQEQQNCDTGAAVVYHL